MSQIVMLLNTLKREMKAQGLTYARVADRLELSESSIKRIFSDSKLSLDRLEQLSQLVGMDITDLVQKMGEERQRIEMLTEEQEREVADDPKLLLMAICALNLWTIDEIIETYDLGEHECIQLLAKLDRLKLIELLPLNRFKLMVANDFQWIPNGPLQTFFRKEVQPAFMKCSFSGAGERFLFRNGMLSRGSNATMMKKIEKLISEFNELDNEDKGLPLEERFGTSVMVAIRPWEFDYFREFRRNPDEKNF